MTKDYLKYEEMTLVLVGDKKLLGKQIEQHEAAKRWNDGGELKI